MIVDKEKEENAARQIYPFGCNIRTFAYIYTRKGIMSY